MSIYIFIPGSHPELSAGELYHRYPDIRFSFFRPDFIVAESGLRFDQRELDQLGGAIKISAVLYEGPKNELIPALAEILLSHEPESKLIYGLSVYGYPEKQLRPLLLDLKKELKKREIRSRFINNQFKNISAAQYKSLRKEKGIELVIAKESDRFLIGKTLAVQNIDSYSKRDYEKPFRDMQMGMLPPKLAQILINLTGTPEKIWDPFCGSGVLIMEGLLMGRDMIGSDLNPRHIEGAQKNIEWLKREFPIKSRADLFVHDATLPLPDPFFSAIAFEGDLGLPHNAFIPEEKLNKIIVQLDALYVRFFQNLKIMSCRQPIVCALPFYRLRNGREIEMTNTISAIEKMGFKRTPLLPDFISSENKFCLKYSRPDQSVGRAIYRFLLK